MLSVHAQRAQLRDGHEILDLGCAWGSLTLWLAERFPASTVTGVSNSASQRAYIEQAAGERGLDNVPGHHGRREDANRDAARQVLAEHAGARATGRQLRRWRLLFLSCEGRCGYDEGHRFIVSHDLFRRAGTAD